MRVCPECGYSDNLLWQNCRFHADLQMMRVEDFKREYPDLIERVESEKYVIDGKFVYHKTRIYVMRKEPTDFNQPFYEKFEAHWKKKTPLSDYGNKRRRELKTQTKLVGSSLPCHIKESGQFTARTNEKGSSKETYRPRTEIRPSKDCKRCTINDLYCPYADDAFLCIKTPCDVHFKFGEWVTPIYIGSSKEDSA